MHTLFSFLESPIIGFLLKLFTGLAAAGFGILGLGANIRDDKGKLTEKGRIALRGIIIAGILALATTVYEAITAQKAAKVEEQKSHRLLTSVERGIYPLREITAVFRLSFHKDFKDLAKYKKRIREAVDKDNRCMVTKDFTCNEYVRDFKYTYRIPITSRLFPKPRSISRTVLNDMNLRIAIYKASTQNSVDGAALTYKPIGSFLIDLADHTPERWQLVYDRASDTLALDVVTDQLPDTSLYTSEVYSLIDFIPGAMTATPDFYGAAFCDDLMRNGVKNCADEVDEALITNLSVDYIRLFFRYPKAIFFDSDSEMSCDYASRRFHTMWFPADIEESTSKLGLPVSAVSPAENHSLCEAMRKGKGRDED